MTPPSALFAAGDSQAAGANIGVVTQIQVDPVTHDAFILVTSHEFYAPSYIVGLDFSTFGTEAVVTVSKTHYGSVKAIFGVNVTAANNELISSAWSHMFFVGNLSGKGTIGSATVVSYTALIVTNIFTDNATSGVVSISAPTGGVSQFKGLTQSTTEDKYVEMVCNGIQPMFYTTAW